MLPYHHVTFLNESLSFNEHLLDKRLPVPQFNINHNGLPYYCADYIASEAAGEQAKSAIVKGVVILTRLAHVLMLFTAPEHGLSGTQSFTCLAEKSRIPLAQRYIK